MFMLMCYEPMTNFLCLLIYFHIKKNCYNYIVHLIISFFINVSQPYRILIFEIFPYRCGIVSCIWASQSISNPVLGEETNDEKSEGSKGKRLSPSELEERSKKGL